MAFGSAPCLIDHGLIFALGKGTTPDWEIFQPFINDPGNIGSGNGLYQMLDQIVGSLLSGTLYSALLWVPLTIAPLGVGYRDWSHRRSWRIVMAAGLAISLYIVGTVILWCEPSNRLGRYFD